MGVGCTSREAAGDPLDPLERLRGDDWEHFAVGPGIRQLLASAPGHRDNATHEWLVRQVHDRTGGRTDPRITSHEHSPHETSIHEFRGVEVARTVVFGTPCLLSVPLGRSTAGLVINTSFVERNNGTDRCPNARKRRKTRGPGDGSSGVLLHRVPQQIPLGRVDAADRGRRGDRPWGAD